MRILPSSIVAIFVVFTQTALGQTANPLEGNDRAIYGGAALFRAQCATCHGADARGISGIDAPDLTLMWAERQLSAREVYDIIRDGIPGSIMPPHGFTEPEYWMLVAYLQDVAVSGVIGLPAGDAGNGASLFASNCAECHRARGGGDRGGVGRGEGDRTEGGSLGPDLTGITSRRSLEALTTSIREPGSLVGPGFKTITVVTGNNESIEGVLKNEDAFSLQLMDRNQRLRAYMKADLRSLDRSTNSLMPVFDSADLGDDELIDILNYLDSP